MFKLNPVIQKLTKKRPQLPILQHVRVQGGYAYSTDLDTWASQPVPSDIEDGIWIVANNKLLKRLEPDTENLTLADYPRPPDFGPKHTNTKLIARISGPDLRFLYNGSCPDVTRHSLMNVCFEGEHGVATDGRVLNQVTLPRHSEVEERVLVSRATVKLVPASKATSAFIYLDTESDIIAIDYADVRLLCKRPEANYPNWQQVVPQYQDVDVDVFTAPGDTEIKNEKAIQMAEGRPKADTRLLFDLSQTPSSLYEVSDRTRMTIIMPLRGASGSPGSANLAIPYLERMGWNGEPFFVNKDNHYAPFKCYTQGVPVK